MSRTHIATWPLARQSGYICFACRAARRRLVHSPTVINFPKIETAPSTLPTVAEDFTPSFEGKSFLFGRQAHILNTYKRAASSPSKKPSNSDHATNSNEPAAARNAERESIPVPGNPPQAPTHPPLPTTNTGKRQSRPARTNGGSLIRKSANAGPSPTAEGQKRLVKRLGRPLVRKLFTDSLVRRIRVSSRLRARYVRLSPSRRSPRGRKKAVEKNPESLGSTKRSKKKPQEPFKGHVASFYTKDLEPNNVLDLPHPEIPKLAHGLDRVLFNPGVYRLQDPRSRVYNFDPSLEKIIPVQEFDFTRLDDFMPPSEDPELARIANQFKTKYLSSTSSLTTVLSLFHFLLSWWRPLNLNMISQGFGHMSDTFTISTKEPTAIFLRKSGNSYAVEKDDEFSSYADPMLAGQMLEKMFTVPLDVFEQYRVSNPDVPTKTAGNKQAFHYSVFEDVLVRSQLDAQDPRLPGSGVFDIKTRAVLPVRMDLASQMPLARSYQLKSEHGMYESFEREFYDMARSTMLKYSLQARLGNMDGLFVAYHNLSQLFGFQYVSIAEMDLILHGQDDRVLGDQELRASTRLLSEVLNRITERYPDQSLRVHFHTSKAKVPFMRIFAEPITEQQIKDIKATCRRREEEYIKMIAAPTRPGELLTEKDIEREIEWRDMREAIEESISQEEAPDEQMRSVELEKFATWADLDCLRTRTLRIGPTLQSLHDRVDAALTESIFLELPDKERALLKILQRIEQADSDLREVRAQVSMREWQATLASPARELEAILEGWESHLETLSDEIVRPMVRLRQKADGGAKPDSALQKPDDGLAAKPSDTKEDKASPSVIKSMKGMVNRDMDRLIDLGGTIGEVRTAEIETPSDTEKTPSPELPKQIETQLSNEADKQSPELMVLTLAIRNRVDGSYVPRPEKLGKGQTWEIEYQLSEEQIDKGILENYSNIFKRRSKYLRVRTDEEKREQWYGIPFLKTLQYLSEKGHEWRRKQEEADKGRTKIAFVPHNQMFPGRINSETAREGVVGGVEEYMSWLYRQGLSS